MQKRKMQIPVKRRILKNNSQISTIYQLGCGLWPYYGMQLFSASHALWVIKLTEMYTRARTIHSQNSNKSRRMQILTSTAQTLECSAEILQKTIMVVWLGWQMQGFKHLIRRMAAFMLSSATNDTVLINPFKSSGVYLCSQWAFPVSKENTSLA